MAATAASHNLRQNSRRKLGETQLSNDSNSFLWDRDFHCRRTTIEQSDIHPCDSDLWLQFPKWLYVDSCSPPTVTPFVNVPKARIIWLWAITKYSPNLSDLSKPFPNTSISCYLPLDCFQVVAPRLCTELVCAHGHVLARGGGPSNQSQASGRARIDLSLQLLMPSDLSTGPVFTSPYIGKYVLWLENMIWKNISL